MGLTARIEKISYEPFLCNSLKRISIVRLGEALEGGYSFILSVDSNIEFAVSHWVSPKRTRSYPYVRVYDTLGFTGKKVTIIPVLKDEGLTSSGSGDRDFIQWDTISLMSLLNVNVILSFYNEAIPSIRYPGKITKQQFLKEHLEAQFVKLAAFQSSALHWNMEQTAPENMRFLFDNAMTSYDAISKKHKIKFHDHNSAIKKIGQITSSREQFLSSSREAAKSAQRREILTVQPKEKTKGDKQSITIQNYLGGKYFLTLDEFRVQGDSVELIEAKHTKKGCLPSWNDIKDGLLKMILLTNITDVKLDERRVSKEVFLKLTSRDLFKLDRLSLKDQCLYKKLLNESRTNGFHIEHSV